MKCPHCPRKGTPETTELVKRVDRMYESGFVPQVYDCPNCGREWTQDAQGYWHSHGATDIETFTPDGKKVKENH